MLAVNELENGYANAHRTYSLNFSVDISLFFFNWGGAGHAVQGRPSAKASTSLTKAATSGRDGRDFSTERLPPFPGPFPVGGSSHVAVWPRPPLPEARARRRQLGRSFRPGRGVSGRVAAMEGEPPPVEERRRLREELSEFVESCCRTLEEVTASLGWSLDRLEPGEEEAAEVRGAGSSRGPSPCGAPVAGAAPRLQGRGRRGIRPAAPDAPGMLAPTPGLRTPAEPRPKEPRDRGGCRAERMAGLGCDWEISGRVSGCCSRRRRRFALSSVAWIPQLHQTRCREGLGVQVTFLCLQTVHRFQDY